MKLRNSLISLVFVLASAGEVISAESDFVIPPDLVTQRFQVAKGGKILLVPVHFAGKDRVFMFDTGATHTMFDHSLPMGNSLRVVRAKTPLGYINMKVYEAPDFSVGTLPFRPIGPPFGGGSGTVFGTDLSRIRRASGLPVEGVIGMDFISQHIVHIDIAKGNLVFLKAVPEAAGVAVPIKLAYAGTATVEASIVYPNKLVFQLDTGFTGFGMISAPDIARLSGQGRLRLLGSTEAIGFSASAPSRCYGSRRITVETLAIDKPTFLESTDSNVLGLEFLTHFKATFDFPGGKLYLQRQSTISNMISNSPD